VAILQGPVAVRHSIKKDEPIKEMLDIVVSGLTAKVSEHFYGGDESRIPAIDCLGVRPAPAPSLPGAHVLRTGNEVKLTPPASLPAVEVLAGPELNWWHAIVRSEFVVQHLILPILFVAFLSLVLARRLSSACSVMSPANSPFMVLHAPLDNVNQIFSQSTSATMLSLASSISHSIQI